MFASLIKRLESTSILYLVTILFALGFLIYANTLVNGLFFDDEHFIYNNQAVTTFSLPDLFGHSLSTGAGQLSNYYRPLLFTGFAFEYALFKDAGFIYHLNSMLLHIGATIGIFLILQKLFQNRFISLLTALLFLIHPVQTEAVSYASGRGDPLSLFFSVIAIYLSLRRSTRSYIFALFFFICALLSKELALITPGLLFLSHLFLEKTLSRKAFLKAFKKALPFFAISIGYFILRITVLNFSNTLNFHQTESIYTESLFVRLTTFFHLIPTYLSLLIFPKDLFMERDSLIAIQTTPTIASSLSFLSLLALAFFAFLKRNQYPILAFGLAWIGISFIPTSGILPINGIFYEHFLYYPSIGFFVILSWLLWIILKKIPSLVQNLLLLLLFFLILILSVRTIARNSEWRNPIVFYEQTLSYAPSARAYNNLAMAYAESNQLEKAVEKYRAAIQLVDAYPETRYNLGNVYVKTNNVKAAEHEYKEALRIDPAFYYAYIQLMGIYTAREDTAGQAWIIQEVEKIVAVNPSFEPLLTSLKQQL